MQHFSYVAVFSKVNMSNIVKIHLLLKVSETDIYIAKLKAHVGGPNSSHNLAVEMCKNFLRQNQHIDSVI